MNSCRNAETKTNKKVQMRLEEEWVEISQKWDGAGERVDGVDGGRDYEVVG